MVAICDICFGIGKDKSGPCSICFGTGHLGLQEVAKEQFYEKIGKEDCHPLMSGSYPYTAQFLTRNRKLIGVNVMRFGTYYLPSQ